MYYKLIWHRNIIMSFSFTALCSYLILKMLINNIVTLSLTNYFNFLHFPSKQLSVNIIVTGD
jgi:hypothetical protein